MIRTLATVAAAAITVASCTAATATPAGPAQSALHAAINRAVASDHEPLDLADTQPRAADAYMLVQDDCWGMARPPQGLTAREWMTAHLLGHVVRGEVLALQIGVPQVCPDRMGDFSDAYRAYLNVGKVQREGATK